MEIRIFPSPFFIANCFYVYVFIKTCSGFLIATSFSSKAVFLLGKTNKQQQQQKEPEDFQSILCLYFDMKLLFISKK